MTDETPGMLLPRLEVTAGSAKDGDAAFSGTREAWLGYVVNLWRPHFDRAGILLPSRIYVSVGRPARGTSTGVCYPGIASDDGAPQIFIHPVIADSTRAAGTLVHQLCHAALGSRSHGGAFKVVALSVGLVGKRMTRTVEGPLFTMMLPVILDRVGPYPHAALRQVRGMDPPKQGRLIRARCPVCGYTIRLAHKWIAVSSPLCSNRNCPAFGEEMDVG